MRKAQFELYKSGNRFRWRLRAPNGEIIASGEAYNTHRACRKGILAVKKYAPQARVEIVTK